MDFRDMTDDQIKHMVDRFLNWKLPENFAPDGGVSFERLGNKGTPHQYRREPSGTNLLDATQAGAMVRYMMEAMMDQEVEAKPDTRTCTCHPDDRPIPCSRKFATRHCWRAAVYEEAREAIVELKGHDRTPREQKFLDHLMRVERALDGTF